MLFSLYNDVISAQLILGIHSDPVQCLYSYLYNMLPVWPFIGSKLIVQLHLKIHKATGPSKGFILKIKAVWDKILAKMYLKIWEFRYCITSLNV